jgi:hypothetical protein
MTDKRVIIVSDVVVALPDGAGKQTYKRGDHYMVPAGLADRLLAERIARADGADADFPCPVCGAIAITEARLRAHVEGNHKQTEAGDEYLAKPFTEPPFEIAYDPSEPAPVSRRGRLTIPGGED